jgi:hypothetical protein
MNASTILSELNHSLESLAGEGNINVPCISPQKSRLWEKKREDRKRGNEKKCSITSITKSLCLVQDGCKIKMERAS